MNISDQYLMIRLYYPKINLWELERNAIINTQFSPSSLSELIDSIKDLLLLPTELWNSNGYLVQGAIDKTNKKHSQQLNLKFYQV